MKYPDHNFLTPTQKYFFKNNYFPAQKIFDFEIKFGF